MDTFFDVLDHLQDNAVWFLAGTAVVCLMLGWLLGRGGRRDALQEADVLRDRLARAETQTKEQARIVARMRSEQGTVASLALSLPSVVRELNSADLHPRRVPGLILQLAEAIFQPGQLLFYRSCVVEPGGKELRLVSHRGLSEVPDELRRVAFGQGKIGWVAEHKLDMLKESWVNLTRTDGLTIDNNHPMLEAGIIGPLVHSHLDNEQLLGVLCIGSPGIRPRDEKLMFQLVTNLGSLALVNADFRKRLREQANHDGLTGLLNKRFFIHKSGSLIVAAEHKAQPLSMFLFDIDHFKNYNDTNGHPAGDELLRQLSRLLVASVRPEDMCCRYGGEEFIVAMPNTDGRTAMQVAERIRQVIEQHPFAHRENQPSGKVTISGGVAAYPRDGSDIAELTQHADEALYKAKRAGRNRILRFRGVHIGDFEDEIDRAPLIRGDGRPA